MKRIKTLLRNRLFWFKNFKPDDAIVIFSEARGGSTWLMELLKHIPGTVVNWEPLHVDYGPVPRSLRLGWRPKIDPEDSNPTYKQLFEKIITFNLSNDWTLKYSSARELLKSKRVITKFVRANQCLPWFVKTFTTLKHQPIYLLRHPITTCISRLKTFESIPNDDVYTIKPIAPFKVPDCLNNDRFIKHQVYINSLQTQLEVEIAIWCLNNADIIEHPYRNKWCAIYYEDLVINPESQFMKLLDQLDLSLSSAQMKRIRFDKPSASNFLGNYQNSNTKQLETFIEALTQKQLEAIQSIFDYFGLKVYSAFSAYPIP